MPVRFLFVCRYFVLFCQTALDFQEDYGTGVGLENNWLRDSALSFFFVMRLKRQGEDRSEKKKRAKRKKMEKKHEQGRE
jgi:hypothetical protein